MKKYKQTIKLAITGHRDIIETDDLRDELDKYLVDIITKNLEKKIVLLSPLADGADRYVADLFLEKQKEYSHLSLIVPLPFDQEQYMEDFDNDSKENFLNFLEKSDHFFEVEHTTDCGYLDVGRYVVNEADVLLALWDGTFNGKIGGTGDIVEYARKRECDVIHFVCTRENG